MPQAVPKWKEKKCWRELIIITCSTESFFVKENRPIFLTCELITWLGVEVEKSDCIRLT